MTKKVVKGSMWTLGGSILPMMVSLVATPFTIRMLGPENYGVVLLVGLIPTYFAFADFGMGVGSTVFASAAYGEGNRPKETEVVWTATFIAAVSAMLVALPIFIFAGLIIDQFNVPAGVRPEAVTGLRITSTAFVIGVLTSVLNSPLLARLRMDLNTITQATPKVLLSGGTPIVLFLGGGVIGAISWAFVAGLIGFVLLLIFAFRLLPELRNFKIDRELIRPLLKFGIGLVVANIAGILLMNFEKLALPKLVSVEALAFYSVAFTFAGMASLFTGAMNQSLAPAFAQLAVPGKEEEFDALFGRMMRLNLIWLPPALMGLFVIAKPFFTLWAGEAFGRESTGPFYILLFGLFFNILAHIPHGTITAKRRTDIFAKLYWIELVIYVVATIALINWLGIAGAAAAYSIRVILDAFIIIWFSKRVAGVSFRIFNHFWTLLAGIVLLLPPVVFAAFYDNFSLWLLAIVPLSLAAYSFLIWRYFVVSDEREWFKQMIGNRLSFFR